MSSAARLLQNAYRTMQKDPVEGVAVELLDDGNMFEWTIYIEGPKDTPYEHGVFQAVMKFPQDYPMSPPSLTFTSEFWHPNVYPDGRVCISILHPPGEDAMSGELPEERWLPTQSVSTILLSVISILSDPNISSPANVDASVQWRKDREGFTARCRELVKKANRDLPAGLYIPHPDTNADEKARQLQRMRDDEEGMNLWQDSDHDDSDACSFGDDGAGFDEDDSDVSSEEDDDDDHDGEQNEKQHDEHEHSSDDGELQSDSDTNNDKVAATATATATAPSPRDSSMPSPTATSEAPAPTPTPTPAEPASGTLERKPSPAAGASSTAPPASTATTTTTTTTSTTSSSSSSSSSSASKQPAEDSDSNQVKKAKKRKPGCSIM